MIEERINIVPILAADISKNVSVIKDIFDKISFKKGTQGEFFIDFVANAIITKKYLIKYVLFRRNQNRIQALFIDSFVIPPDDDFFTKTNVTGNKMPSNWSIGKGNIISSHTRVNLSYDTINSSGEYGVLAFGKSLDDNVQITNIDETDISDMELLCEKHFFVNIIE